MFEIYDRTYKIWMVAHIGSSKTNGGVQPETPIYIYIGKCDVSVLFVNAKNSEQNTDSILILG